MMYTYICFKSILQLMCNYSRTQIILDVDVFLKNHRIYKKIVVVLHGTFIGVSSCKVMKFSWT